MLVPAIPSREHPPGGGVGGKEIQKGKNLKGPLKGGNPITLEGHRLLERKEHCGKTYPFLSLIKKKRRKKKNASFLSLKKETLERAGGT